MSTGERIALYALTVAFFLHMVSHWIERLA